MTNMITQPSEHLQGLIRGFKTLHPHISYAEIAAEANISRPTVMRAAKGTLNPYRSTRLAIENALVRMAEREVAKKAFCNGVNAAHYALIDDQIESASSREKAELQKALAERVDQLAQANLSVARQADQLVYLRAEIKRLSAMADRANEQAQSSLADLTKANNRIACQSESIDTLQQQLSAERISYSDKIERLQSDLDLMQHEYTKAQTALTNSDKRITQITQDKVKLSHERDRLQSRAEVFKITAFTFGALWLVTLFCLIVILVG